jgi:protein-tyrosine phosphatase
LKILFVCTGNICRSPTGEAVMKRLVRDAGLSSEFVIDSAGTGSFHVGEAPDPRAVAVAAARGCIVEGTARRVEPGDLSDFDLIVGMDRGHVRALRDMSLDLESRLKVRPLLADEDVPDPYAKPPAEFEEVFEVIERGCRDLLAELTGPPF